MTKLTVGREGSPLVSRDNHPFGSNELVCLCSNLLTAAECQAIVADAETIGGEHGWGSRYTYQELSSDLHAEALPVARSVLDFALPERILPAVAAAFPYAVPNGPASLRVHNAIVVKYDASANKTRMPSHTDASVITVNVALTPTLGNFEGGGTWVQALASRPPYDEEKEGFGGTLRSPKAGDALIQAGRIKHGGAPISSGVRHILTIFMHVDTFVDHAMRHQVRVQRALALFKVSGLE
jgi:hypothetical protein